MLSAALLSLAQTPVQKGSGTSVRDKNAPVAPSGPAASSNAAQLNNEKAKGSSSGQLPQVPDKPHPSASLEMPKGATTSRAGLVDEVVKSEDKLAQIVDHQGDIKILIFVVTLVMLLSMCFAVLFLTKWLGAQINHAGSEDAAVQSQSEGGFSPADREVLRKTKISVEDCLARAKSTPDVASKLSPIIEALSENTRRLASLDADLRKSRAENEAVKKELGAARDSLSPLHEKNVRLEQDNDDLKSRASAFQRDLNLAISDRDSFRESKEVLRVERDNLSAANSKLESELKSERASLASANSALREARQAADANGVQLEASFARLAPTFLADPEIAQFMRKLHGESLAGVGSATAVWSTLTAFASAEVDPAAKDFQLHVLKRLGTVLVHYWKDQPGSTPKDRLERLSHWARCLNEQAQGRFNLFAPAIGAPVDRTKMTTLTSATIVQEVLCWQVRNPAGANYSLAEVA